MNRREFLKKAVLGCGVGAGGVGAYTFLWEPHWVEFRVVSLPIRGLPAALAGKGLVQMTDLHVGPRVSDNFLLETFRKVAEMAPEFVVYTGDFMSYEPGILAHAERILSELPRGRRGTFGVLGNHDYGINWADAELADEIAGIARNAGVTMLRNEVAELDGLQVAGLDDLWADRFDAPKGLAGLQRDKAAIVLSHNPDTADLPVWGDFSGWILAGHTHGGQCKAPFLPPPLLPVKNRRYTSGKFELAGGRRMYISRGLGHLLKVRFNVRPEVTVFRLEPA